jgi:hypothetical protein
MRQSRNPVNEGGKKGRGKWSGGWGARGREHGRGYGICEAESVTPAFALMVKSLMGVLASLTVCLLFWAL